MSFTYENVNENYVEKKRNDEFSAELGTWPNSLALRRLVTDCDSVKFAFIMYFSGCFTYIYILYTCTCFNIIYMQM